jgi:hypothetical protein
MNSDSLIGLIRSDFASTHPFVPATLALASTTDTTVKFANTTGPAIVSIPTGTAIIGSATPNDPNSNQASLVTGGRPGQATRASAPQYTPVSFDGRPFILQAFFKGTVVSSAGGASVWTPKLWNGTNSTPGSNNTILATTGISVPASHTANANCFIQATLIWDSVSQTLGGEVYSVINAFDVTAAGVITAVYNSRGAITTLSAITLSPNLLNFLTSVQIQTTAPTSSSSILTELSLSQI